MNGRKSIPCVLLQGKFWHPYMERSYSLNYSEFSPLLMSVNFSKLYAAIWYKNREEYTQENVTLEEGMRLIETLVMVGEADVD